MDWLAYHRALIDCYEKIVRIPLPNGKILEVQGERPEKDLGSFACIKTDEKKLDDIRVVRDFPEVFPDDLLGLPLMREIKFRIDLIPVASPVVRSPFRCQEALGTRLDMSTDYHPQTDAQSERTIQKLKDMLRVVLWIFVAVGILISLIESPVIWTEVGESQLIGPEIVQETTEKIVQIKERLKTARSLQKSYADKSVPLDEIEIDKNLRFIEEPIEIIERDVKKLK
ncbi:putative reverse transcriptase domain-containing protein [Tanacetum coccineum]